MDSSVLLHAYAVLGLSPPVTEARLKRRYKALVRRWHPDRFQADPVGQAEATQRLRNINLAYDVVAKSIGSTVASELAQPTPDEMNSPFSWSHDRVDAIVDSINRLNRVSLIPEMSVHRWLSLGAIAIYILASIPFFAHAGPDKRELTKALGKALGYFWLPLYLIWTGDREDLADLTSRLCRFAGWLLMAAPAIVGMALWIMT